MCPDGPRFQCHAGHYGNRLRHFTPFPSPGSSGVNLFAQDLRRYSSIMQRKYVFPHWFCLVHFFVFWRVIDSHAPRWSLTYIPENIGGLCFNLGRLHRVCWRCGVIPKPFLFHRNGAGFPIRGFQGPLGLFCCVLVL